MRIAFYFLILFFALTCAVSCNEGNETNYEDNDIDMLEKSPQERMDEAAHIDTISEKSALDTLQGQ